MSAEAASNEKLEKILVINPECTLTQEELGRYYDVVVEKIEEDEYNITSTTERLDLEDGGNGFGDNGNANIDITQTEPLDICHNLHGANLKELDKRYVQLTNGLYHNLCRNCGQPISLSRLSIHPTATTCKDCCNKNNIVGGNKVGQTVELTITAKNKETAFGVFGPEIKINDRLTYKAKGQIDLNGQKSYEPGETVSAVIKEIKGQKIILSPSTKKPAQKPPKNKKAIIKKTSKKI